MTLDKTRTIFTVIFSRQFVYRRSRELRNKGGIINPAYNHNEGSTSFVISPGRDAENQR
jgi:hypothetical protein